MRILFVSATYAPFFEAGGPPVKVRALAEGLVARGHQVTVLTADFARRGGVQVERQDGVDVVYLPIVVARRFVPATRGASRFIRERGASFDVAQIFGLYDPLGPTVARRLRKLRIPYLVEPMGMFQAIIRSRLKKRIFHLFFGRKLLGGAAAVVATAPSERQELIEGGIPADRVVIRDNGLDLSRFDDLPDPGGFRARERIPEGPITLFLGRLARKKRPEIALRAFAASRVPGTLVFVGPDEDGFGDRLRAEARSLGVADRVRIIGPIYEEADLLACLVDADVFVLPSENENFGNAVAEAMACGVPVIISDRCGIAPIVAEGGGGVVLPLDQGRFAEALRRVLGDDAFRAGLASAARRTAGGLDWDRPVGEMEDLYPRLLDGEWGRA